MCDIVKLVSKVKSGELSYCRHCKSFHLMFNNLFFALTQQELNRLKQYVDSLDISYWEAKYEHSNLNRKIPLPTTQDNLIIMLNTQEVRELRRLLAFKNYKYKQPIAFLNVDDIDYQWHMN